MERLFQLLPMEIVLIILEQIDVLSIMAFIIVNPLNLTMGILIEFFYIITKNVNIDPILRKKCITLLESKYLNDDDHKILGLIYHSINFTKTGVIGYKRFVDSKGEKSRIVGYLFNKLNDNSIISKIMGDFVTNNIDRNTVHIFLNRIAQKKKVYKNKKKCYHYGNCRCIHCYIFLNRTFKWHIKNNDFESIKLTIDIFERMNHNNKQYFSGDYLTPVIRSANVATKTIKKWNMCIFLVQKLLKLAAKLKDENIIKWLEQKEDNYWHITRFDKQSNVRNLLYCISSTKNILAVNFVLRLAQKWDITDYKLFDLLHDYSYKWSILEAHNITIICDCQCCDSQNTIRLLDDRIVRINCIKWIDKDDEDGIEYNDYKDKYENIFNNSNLLPRKSIFRKNIKH